MARKTAHDRVIHPRYGKDPVPSGLTIPAQEILSSYWGYNNAKIFPESVIEADVTEQVYSIFPRRYYVDILKTCISCGRDFIFFALEQQYWYETLHFWIDADCVNCVECRKTNQEEKRHLKSYSKLIKIDNKSRADIETLIADAVYLSSKGVIRNISVLGNIKNEATIKIPDCPLISALEGIIKDITDDT